MFDETKRHLALNLTYVFDEKSQTDMPTGQLPTSETKTFLNTLKMIFDIESNTLSTMILVQAMLLISVSETMQTAPFDIA